MKIGVFFTSKRSSGGIFHYSHSLIKALNSWDTSHEFVILHKADLDLDISPYLLKTNWSNFIVPDDVYAMDENIRNRYLAGDGLDLMGRDRVNLRTTRMLENLGIGLVIYPFNTAACFEINIPYIVAIHDIQHRIHPEFPEVSAAGEWRQREYMNRNSCRYAEGILADSDVGVQDVLDFYGDYILPERVHRLPFVPSFPKLSPEKLLLEAKRVRQKYNLERPFAFYPAQFWQHKNHARLVYSIFELEKKFGIKLDLALGGSNKGGTPQQGREQNFNNAMDLAHMTGIQERIHYLGYVDDADMPGLYAAAAMLAMPTFFGPTNIPYLEAWTYGCPVLTSDIRGLREQVGDAGVLVNLSEVRSIAQGMAQILNDAELRQKIITNGTLKINEYGQNEFSKLAQDIVKKAISQIKTPDQDPALFDELLNLGEVAFGQGQLELALEKFEQCLKINGQSAQVYNNLGVVLAELGQIKNAQKAFESALNLEPNHQDSRYNLEQITLDESLSSVQNQLNLLEEWPKISIVVPHFNLGQYLEKCITSVLDQNYPNLELIIIDGGSTDQSLQVIKKYQKHLKYWISEKDRGQSDAINKGLAQSSGEIWNWLCSDDYLLPGALEKVALAYKQNPQAVAWVGACERLHETGWLHYISYPSVLSKEHILSNFSARAFYQPAAFLKRSVVQSLGGVNVSLRFAMEYDLYRRMVHCGDFVKMEGVIAVALAQPNAKTVSQTGAAWTEKVPLLRAEGLEEAAQMLEKRITTGIHQWIYPQGWRNALSQIKAPIELPFEFQKRTVYLVHISGADATWKQTLLALKPILDLNIERYPQLEWHFYSDSPKRLYELFADQAQFKIVQEVDWSRVFAVIELADFAIPSSLEKNMRSLGIPLLSSAERFKQLGFENGIDGFCSDHKDANELSWKSVLMRLDPLVWGAMVSCRLASEYDATGQTRAFFTGKATPELKPHSKVKYKICIFVMREYHIPVLEGIYEEALKHSHLEVGFAHPPFRPAQGAVNETGLNEAMVESLFRKGWQKWDITVGQEVPEKFDAVILADACYEMVEGWGPAVCVGHGTISKNLYFIDELICRRENQAALVCVPGPYYQTSYGSQVVSNVVATGFSKMDALALDSNQMRAQIVEKYQLLAHQKILLYAPTFNEDLTSIEMFLDLWEQEELKNWTVLIKLHGSTRAPIKQYFQNLSAQKSNLIYVQDQELNPSILAADVMLSDFSSAILEFLATGKPVIVGNNPLLSQSPAYNSKSIEVQSRKYCYQAQKSSEVIEFLKQIALGQDHLKMGREEFVSQLFMPIDGKNCERIVHNVIQLCQNPLAYFPEGAQSVSVFLPNTPINMNGLQKLKEDSAFGVNFYIQVQHPELEIILQNALQIQLPIQVLPALETPKVPCLCTDGFVNMGPEWDRTLFNASRMGSTKGAWFPAFPLGQAPDEFVFKKRLPQIVDAPFESYRAHAKVHFLSERWTLKEVLNTHFYVPQDQNCLKDILLRDEWHQAVLMPAWLVQLNPV